MYGAFHDFVNVIWDPPVMGAAGIWWCALFHKVSSGRNLNFVSIFPNFNLNIAYQITKEICKHKNSNAICKYAQLCRDIIFIFEFTKKMFSGNLEQN